MELMKRETPLASWTEDTVPTKKDKESETDRKSEREKRDSERDERGLLIWSLDVSLLKVFANMSKQDKKVDSFFPQNATRRISPWYLKRFPKLCASFFFNNTHILQSQFERCLSHIQSV